VDDLHFGAVTWPPRISRIVSPASGRRLSVIGYRLSALSRLTGTP
jgi:hypothetical protein